MKLKGKARKKLKMEYTGLEPVTSTLPVWRAPNCANTPRSWKYYVASLLTFIKDASHIITWRAGDCNGE